MLSAFVRHGYASFADPSRIHFVVVSPTFCWHKTHVRSAAPLVSVV